MIPLKNFHSLVLLLCLLSAVALAPAQENPPAKERARDLGVPFDGTPGPLNAITDVPPRGKDSMSSPVFAGWWSLNGNGEMTGTTWVEESGFLDGPVMITNTHSVGVVRDAVIAWQVKTGLTPKTNT